MDLDKYCCKVVSGRCSKCWDESLQKAWEEGPPEWLIKYPDGDFGTIHCVELVEWQKQNILYQPCLLVEIGHDYGSDEAFTLCQRHVMAIAAMITQENCKT